MIWVCSLGVTLKPAMGNDYLNFFPRSSTMVIYFTSLWDVKLLVRMLEKEDGFVGSTLKKKIIKPKLRILEVDLMSGSVWKVACF